jgi:hypothetical protein
MSGTKKQGLLETVSAIMLKYAEWLVSWVVAMW